MAKVDRACVHERDKKVLQIVHNRRPAVGPGPTGGSGRTRRARWTWSALPRRSPHAKRVVGACSGPHSRPRGVRRRPRRHRAASSSACPGGRADGHDFAVQAVANGAVALVVERPLDVAVPRLPGRRCPRPRWRSSPIAALRATDQELDRGRGHWHERQDDDDLPGWRRSSRRRRSRPGLIWHDRDSDRRGAAAGSAYDARGDRPPARVPRDARRRRPQLRARSHLARVAAQAARPRPLRVPDLHEPEPGPPRPARDDGGVLRGEAPAVPRHAPARGDQLRRPVGTARCARSARRARRTGLGRGGRRDGRAAGLDARIALKTLRGGGSTSRTRSARSRAPGCSASTRTTRSRRDKRPSMGRAGPLRAG